MTPYIDAWFPTLVYYSDNNCTSMLSEYKNFSLGIFKELECERHPFGESKLNTSFWHDQYGHLYNDNRFVELCLIIKQQAIDFCDALGYKSLNTSQLTFLNMWINVVGPHDYHAQHTHNTIGRAAISGIFYVDAPSGAKISFGSPYRDSHEPVKPWSDTPANFSKIDYDCIPGRIVMFKSNVYHGYDSHGQEKNKISIPFNIAIQR